MSSKRYVLIFSQDGEPGTASVIQHLERQNTSYIVLNFEMTLLDSTWTISPSLNKFTLKIGNSVVDQDSIACIWNRRWGIPFVPAHFDQVEVQFAFGEVNSCYAALYNLIPSASVNDLLSERQWSNKIAQLKLAKKLEARVPRTIVTSDADAVREFYLQEKGKVVFKSTAGTAPFLPIYSNAAHRSRMQLEEKGLKLNPGISAPNSILFTQRLDEQKLNQIESVKWAPVTFQEWIDKRADVRVTVIGDEHVACLIDSQADVATSVDFRRFAFGVPVSHSLIELPSHVRNFIRKYMSETGLVFGFMDFAIDSVTEEWVFLECNPNAQWSWIDDFTGAGISRLIAEYFQMRT